MYLLVQKKCSFLTILILFVYPVVIQADKQLDLSDGKIFTKLQKAPEPGRVLGEVKAIVFADSFVVWEVLNNPESFMALNKRFDVSRRLSEKFVGEYIEADSGYDEKMLEKVFHEASLEGGTEKQGQAFYFRHLNMPWPLKDEWLVMEEIADDSELEKGIYKLRSHQIIGSIDHYTSTWEIQPKGDGKTLVYFKSEMNMGFEVPQALLTLGKRVDLPNSIQTLRKLVKSKGNQERYEN